MTGHKWSSLSGHRGSELGVYSGEQSRMQLLAAFAGRQADVDAQLHTGVWLQPRLPLVILIDPDS